MKNKLASIAASILFAAVLSARAGEPPTENKPCSPEFERMKSLVGTWTGKTDMGEGPVDLTLQFRLLAGGTVLEERCFAGTPHEMVTMYYEKNGKLALTHYCVLGNRPGMVLKSSDSKTLRFELDPQCGIDPKKESHMNALTLTFADSDTILAACKAYIDGKEMPETPTTLRRVKQ